MEHMLLIKTKKKKKKGSGTYWVVIWYKKDKKDKLNQVIWYKKDKKDKLNHQVTYFDSFGVEYLSTEIITFIGNKNIKTNIFRIQADNSIKCGYICIGFIDFMLAGKSLIDFTSLLSPYDFKKNDDVISSYFK